MKLFRITGFAIIALFLNSCTSTRFAEKKFNEARAEVPFDVVIVPGVPIIDGEQSDIMKARILWSKYLVDSGFTKNVIYSGAAVYTPYMEGRVMKIFADSLGLNPSNTFEEIQAEHSTENLYLGIKLAKKLGFKKIALATDPFQTKMLRTFIKKRCKGTSVIPVVFTRIDPTKQRLLSLPKINPQAGFVKDFIPLPKRQGFFERLRGTNGKHIDFNQP